MSTATKTSEAIGTTEARRREPAEPIRELAEVTIEGAAERSTRELIEALPFRTYFWSRDLPGKRSTSSAALTRLLADPDSGIERRAPGLYWRGYPAHVPNQDREHGRGVEKAALVYAGPGAGEAQWSAVYMLAWAHQSSRFQKVAVVRRRLKPTETWVRFIRRENLRRMELTWLEVSVLEALALLDFVEYPWERCIEHLASGLSGWSIGGSGVFRPDMLVWAAQADDLATPDVLHRAAQIKRELPEIVLPEDDQPTLRVWTP